MKKILVTGSAGYIGSVLTRQLLDKGYYVRGLDILNYGGESLVGLYNYPSFDFIKGDIRGNDVLIKAINGMDAVIHLAAIVGDPACAKQPELVQETNWIAAKALYDRCSESGSIKQFVFASTCSNYGKMQGSGYVNEESPLKPVSLYAELKVKFEEYILNSKPTNGIAATALRFSTAYGLSNRMRFDLTINEFTKELVLGKELIVFGEQFWRPYCHVNDIVGAIAAVLDASHDKSAYNTFNVGDTSENYTKKMIVDEIQKHIPDAKIKYVKKDEDPRDYRVSFEKIKKELSFTISKTVPDGIVEIIDVIKKGVINNTEEQRFYNIPH